MTALILLEEFEACPMLHYRPMSEYFPTCFINCSNKSRCKFFNTDWSTHFFCEVVAYACEKFVEEVVVSFPNVYGSSQPEAIK